MIAAYILATIYVCSIRYTFVEISNDASQNRNANRNETAKTNVKLHTTDKITAYQLASDHSHTSFVTSYAVSKLALLTHAVMKNMVWVQEDSLKQRVVSRLALLTNLHPRCTVPMTAVCSQ